MLKHLLIIGNDAHIIKNGQIFDTVLNAVNSFNMFRIMRKRHGISDKISTWYTADSLEIHLKNLEVDKYLDDFEKSNREFPIELFLPNEEKNT